MNFKSRQREEVDPNLTPLIDVVFLLLIFFMVTTTFQRETELKVNLPEAEAQAVEDQQAALEIIVDSRGRYFVDGHELVNSSPDTLSAALNKLTVGRKDRPVILRADSGVNFQAVVTAMDVAAKLGLLHMSIATSEPALKKGGRE